MTRTPSSRPSSCGAAWWSRISDRDTATSPSAWLEPSSRTASCMPSTPASAPRRADGGRAGARDHDHSSDPRVTRSARPSGAGGSPVRVRDVSPPPGASEVLRRRAASRPPRSQAGDLESRHSGILAGLLGRHGSPPHRLRRELADAGYRLVTTHDLVVGHLFAEFAAVTRPPTDEWGASSRS